MIARQLNRAAFRDGVRRLGSATTGTVAGLGADRGPRHDRRAARLDRAARRTAGEGPGHASLVGAGRRVLPDRGQGRPPAHRPKCPLVLDERNPRGVRDLLLRAGRVHRGPPHRRRTGARDQPAPAVGQARLQPRPVPALLRRHGRCRPVARWRDREFRAARLADGVPGDVRREHGRGVRRDRRHLPRRRGARNTPGSRGCFSWARSSRSRTRASRCS